ncbi:transglutaminase-like domain-containing protein [Pseudanabaena sp. PCC 6802]|uniref:transglutaminase-like domain-containing protein n=1 Tax=Pseudanabaena sp. PCC 6802 TaxID=118173 RepID=UPI00034836C9|nr:transglutaminase family protein [Pseudanabaena sp. PCC 6802]
MSNLSDSLPNLIRPAAAYTLYGLVWISSEAIPYAIALDTYQGNLLKIDPHTDSASILNPYTARQFRNASGIAISGDKLFVTKGNSIYYCNMIDFDLQPYMELPDRVEGIAVSEGGVYVSSSQASKIFVFGRATRGLLRVMPAPGIGLEALTLRDNELWICDRTEETVYCLEAKTGAIKFRALVPFPKPTGLGFCGNDLYVVYTDDEYYIRDNPNDPEPLSVQVRDRTFIHKLNLIQVDAKPRYTLSNGYLVEMIYLEETSSEDPQDVHDLTWRIALPTNTDRQKVRSVEPMGMPFTEEIVEGQRVAVFEIGELRADEARLFGWKAILEMRGIKYEIPYTEVETIPPLSPEMQAQYLIDDDGLGMDLPAVQAAAKEAVGRETNIIRKMLAIRDYVYDKLQYRMQPYIDTPDLVLARGTGSCGEYVGVLLALARLNGIACRTVGRYKCPPEADRHNVPLYQYYNHVWIEFYVPTIGWLPMESNPDDLGDRPYPTRFFMGLPWYHVEIGKGISFETIQPQPFSIGELALNHVRFRILGEL